MRRRPRRRRWRGRLWREVDYDGAFGREVARDICRDRRVAARGPRRRPLGGLQDAQVCEVKVGPEVGQEFVHDRLGLARVAVRQGNRQLVVDRRDADLPCEPGLRGREVVESEQPPAAAAVAEPRTGRGPRQRGCGVLGDLDVRPVGRGRRGHGEARVRAVGVERRVAGEHHEAGGRRAGRVVDGLGQQEEELLLEHAAVGRARGEFGGQAARGEKGGVCMEGGGRREGRGEVGEGSMHANSER